MAADPSTLNAAPSSPFAEQRKLFHWPRCPMHRSSVWSGKSLSGAGATSSRLRLWGARALRVLANAPSGSRTLDRSRQDSGDDTLGVEVSLRSACAASRDLIISIAHESFELAGWADHKPRTPHLRRTRGRVPGFAFR